MHLLHTPSSVCAAVQYSVTTSFRPAVVNGVRQSVLPGVFWVYDLSPFMVEASTYHTPFSEFLTGLCAIIGGVLTVRSSFVPCPALPCPPLSCCVGARNGGRDPSS